MYFFTSLAKRYLVLLVWLFCCLLVARSGMLDAGGKLKMNQPNECHGDEDELDQLYGISEQLKNNAREEQATQEWKESRGD